MKIASFFSGAGGLDLGFENSGFKLVYANDNWKGCKETFEKNHKIQLDLRSIVDVTPENIPEVDGFVGGPPCQSWSLAGAMKGIDDNRGKLFYNYIKLLEAKRPYFFLAENVAGIVSSAHIDEFKKILNEFEKIGYTTSFKLLSAENYEVPQYRKRVIIVGYRKDLNLKFQFPEPLKRKVTLTEAIGDLKTSSKEALDKNKTNKDLEVPNHEHMNGGFSTIYMSRNRRKKWEDCSFTIQAGGRHAPLHPDSDEMIKVEKDKWVFKNGENSFHRRLSVRECARVQTFPDNFIFYYENIADGYKMIGNAVPVRLAEHIAKKIYSDLKNFI